MSSATLPVIPLPYPLILLPTARATIPIPGDAGETLLHLVQESDAQPVVAAVPIPSAESDVLHDWGSSARIVRLVRPPRTGTPSRDRSRPYLLTLHGLSRVYLPNAKDSQGKIGDLLEHKVELHTNNALPTAEAASTFKAAALKLLDRLVKDAASDTKRDFYMKLATMTDEVSIQRTPWMADMLVANLNAEYADKLDYLSAVEPDDRLSRATAMMVKQTSISEVSRKIAQSVDESLSKQQKEFFLRQQMAAIQRELRDLQRNPKSPTSELDEADEQVDAEDMAEMRSKIEAMAKDSEERKMAVREWRRLKRTPSTSVESGVIRNYLEWLTAIPWPTSVSSSHLATTAALRDRDFMAKARQQLDADHFGLDKIKKRLTEYLAVVRLKELQSEKEARMAAEKEAQLQSHAGEASSQNASLESEARPADPESPNKALVKVSQGTSTPSAPIPLPKKKGVKGPILLFVGPPGTGKTSLGQSIARALGRPFQRISLGGVRDEAEIRGHRRTYVASGPGNIVQALRKAGRPDPVILLDEVDKLASSNFHGDPGAALLEVLDPEQNHSFNDHYINVPIDLSQVLFICTANTLDTIAAPLLDRCEIVHLSGYTYDEKMHIARKFLLPKQLQANGLTTDHLELTEPALLRIATHYTREAGVRSLERAIGAVVRFKAVGWAEYCDSIGAEPDTLVPHSEGETVVGAPAKQYKKVVEEDELEQILGIARWDEEEREREERRGLVYGLVVTGMGEGGILPVETTVVPGSGKLKLTGSLGDVIKESGELALSWVKTHAYDLYITKSPSEDPLKNPDPIDIHLHLPSGAVKKDGPSAGIAMTCAFVSLLTGACVPSNVAMTGEVTLRGRVGPVGGIKEKVLGAHRAQITTVILPWANRKDVEHDVPPQVRKAMHFVFVRTLDEVLEAAFGKGVIGWRRNISLVESRL
ncbi:ATP-dependent protease La [Wolfiporia cocos MD-104 SS10]|uniref:Lon protease homolog n=1 Tax=Wolfiporia cocos (strain MD-104) TaxID=742152 RepID=A0A2H3K1Z2_WOLCO|nr:ATP-dependent protease La [Wolfiporia cocos MD-104 SS10]